MPKKINYPKEVKEEALKHSKNIKVIRDYVEAKTGVRPSISTVKRWKEEYNSIIKTETNDYIEARNEEFSKYYTNLRRKLKRCI